MSNSHSDDNELLEKIKTGDQVAFTTFYNKYYDPIYIVIYNIVKNKDVADDLISVAFTKAYLRSSTYINQISPYMWLKTIATNTAIDFLRKNKKETNNKYVDDEANYIQLSSSDYYSPERILEYEETQNTVSNAMMKLKSRHREVLEKKFAGLTYKQIAEETGVSEAIVKSSLNKARTKLKKLINL